MQHCSLKSEILLMPGFGEVDRLSVSYPSVKQHRAGQKPHYTRRQIAPGDNNVGNTPGRER